MAGRVLVVGGSPEFVGAVYLAGIAALRAGAESVIVMAPTKVAWALNALSPDLMTRKLLGSYLSRAHEAAIRRLLETADILLIGNGAGMRPETATLMRALSKWPGLKVIDADALKVLGGSAVRNAILTPNEREWRMLEKRSIITKLLAGGNVIIKKSARTEILLARKRIKLPKTNPGLAKAGMGDVLAGLCAGYLAQQIGRPTSNLLEAAKLACKTGNEAADILTKRKKGYPGRTGYFLASDLAEELRKMKRAHR